MKNYNEILNAAQIFLKKDMNTPLSNSTIFFVSVYFGWEFGKAFFGIN